MSRLKELPTSFLEHNLRSNPGAVVFPWTENGVDVTRQMILDELDSRIEGERIVCQDLERKIKEGRRLRDDEPPVDLAKKLTVLITTSVIPSHPSTAIIDETIRSIRWHLPKVPILVLADGIRSEEMFRSSAYDIYKFSLREKYPVKEFVSFEHQAGMLRSVLREKLVTTDLILWVEHDFPLTEEFIDWDGIAKTLLDGEFSYVRFANDEHRELPETYRGTAVSKYGVRLFRTVQYSGWPHVARRDFFEALARQFNEAKIHLECGPTTLFFMRDNGKKFKLGIYRPDGLMRRCRNLDGRNSGRPVPLPDSEKLPMRF